MPQNERLLKTEVFKVLRQKCSESGDEKVISLVNDVYEYSRNRLKTVIKNLPEFTLHDEEHVYNMLVISKKIITKDKLSQYSVPELMLIIISISLHDIGMAPSEKSIMSWRNLIENDELNDVEIKEKKDFMRYRKTHVNILREIDVLNNNGEFAKAQLLENYIISSYIRTTHSIRAKQIIFDDWEGKIMYRDTDLTAQLASICYSHTEDYSYILEMDNFYMCDDDTYLNIPFICVILRLADIVDFDPKRTPKVLYSHLAVSNPVSMKEWNKHLSINAWTINPRKLIFSAQCTHPAIESAINEFCDLIDVELRNSALILSNVNGEDYDIDSSKYKLQLPAQVNRKRIQAKKDIVTGMPIYRYNNTKFSLSKNQVIDLLMGTKLYGKPEVALRELIQNSIDACLFRDKLCEQWGEPYIPRIEVSLETEGNEDYLVVDDNGIGMNQYIIDNYYSNVGSSYYKSNDFYDLVSKFRTGFTPISRFGIGILACFMVSDHLEVNTKRMLGQYEYDESLKLTIEGYDSLFVIVDSEKKSPGTVTRLKLRKNHPWEKLTEKRFIESIKRVVPNPPFEIFINTSTIIEKHSKTEIKSLDLSQIKDYSWNRNDNVTCYRLEFDNDLKGISGVCDIAVLTSKSKFVNTINISTKDVQIDDEYYNLAMDMKYGKNRIERHSDNISVNDEGEIELETSYSNLFSSKSSLSIHGIEVPCKLIPDYTTIGEKAQLNFPLPIAFKIDIVGENDLNLNSARTKIIYDEKWLRFERDFYEILLSGLTNKMSDRKWNQLKRVIKDETQADFIKELLSDM